jgi:hypothetical protein
VADDTRIWALIKNGHTARAVARQVPGVGHEFRYLWDDEVRATQVYRNSVELAEAASRKREELLAAGWIDQPRPTWGN